MPTTNLRSLWKGAISFGLVHIPIALYPATSEQGLDFDWLDKRSMDPVGYKRINKKTGKEIDRENIVKGIEYEEGQYVILSPEDIEAAYPKTTQTIEIETFVPLADIPFIYMDRPYYVAPINKGAKVYALLREILHKNGMAGIARVVIQTKQHLAALIPMGPVLVLNLLRWEESIRTPEALPLPAQGMKAAGLTEKEMQMGEQLVADMSTDWNPEAYKDTFKEQILQLVHKKVKAGQIEIVTEIGPMETPEHTATIYDLTELLQQSLKRKSKPAQAAASVKKAKPGKQSSPKPIRKKTAKAKSA